MINTSLGGPGAGAVFEDTVSAYPNTTFVVAAGNDGTNNDSSPRYPCNVTTANLICVAATNQTDALASFSNYGSGAVDLAAPGTSIRSASIEVAAVSKLFEGFEGSLRRVGDRRYQQQLGRHHGASRSPGAGG